MDQGGEKILESSPSLGLGTIYIIPFRGMTNLTTRIWVWSLGTVWKGHYKKLELFRPFFFKGSLEFVQTNTNITLLLDLS